MRSEVAIQMIVSGLTGLLYLAITYSLGLSEITGQAIGFVVILIVGFFLARIDRFRRIVQSYAIAILALFSMSVVINIALLRQNLVTQSLTTNTTCFAFLEENGQVVMEAEHFTNELSGRPHSSGAPDRDAASISWQDNPDFPGTLQALPDIQDTNTMSETNGPALLYVINFETPGKYYVYVRGFGVNGAGDSIHVGLGGTAASINYVNGLSLLTDPKKPIWVSHHKASGANVVVDVPAPGIYTFYLWMRENGVIIDKIWLDRGQGKVNNGDTSPNPSESQCK